MAAVADADAAVQARGLIRRARHAALATALPGAGGDRPYVSLVTVAAAADASPVLLLSGLADHTRALAEDARAALLFEEASLLANPQTGARVSLVGRIRPTAEAALARRFLARHPGAGRYAGFADFGFYRMDVERAHVVGGFGAARWLGGRRVLFDAAAASAVAAAEEALIQKYNADFAAPLARLGRALGPKRGRNWRLIGADPEGIDLRCANTFRRLAFDAPVLDGRGLRAMLSRIMEN